jgi:outer membrane protein assembly factor BamB
MIGTSSAAIHLYGINASDSAVFAIDPNSGKLLWQYRFKANLDDRPIVFRDTVVVVEHGPIDRIVTVLDARTGKPRWTSDEPIVHVPFQHNDNRLVLLYRDGVLRVRDMTTGRLLGERSGLPPNGSNYWVIGDFVYQTANVLYRTPLTGDRPPETIADISNGIVAQCGRDVCAWGRYQGDEVIVLDMQSGREVRRLKAQMYSAPQISARGMIFPDGFKVYDYNGVDITPATLVEGSAQWAGDDHLLLTRVHGPANFTLPSNGPMLVSPDSTIDVNTALQAGLSIYSFTTGEETPLGEVVLRGDCGAAQGRHLCPTETGFTLYRWAQ